MFDDALIESAGKIATKSKWLSLGTFLLDAFVLASLILWPLLHPQALPNDAMQALLIAPVPPATAPVIVSKHPISQVQNLQAQLVVPSRIPTSIQQAKEDAAGPAKGVVIGATPFDPGDANRTMSDVIGPGGGETPPIVKPPSKVIIASRVMAGNKIFGAVPLYPAIAKAAHIQGTVVLRALISKDGAIENVQVVSGPAMLQGSAVEAVRGWRYRPYLLNGEPVDVETTIDVVFRLDE
jgi:protein TonB